MNSCSLNGSLFAALGLFAFSVVYSVTAVEAALFLALALLLARSRRENTLGGLAPALAAHPLFIPWLVYLGVCLLTALTAYYPGKGLGQLNSDFLRYLCLSTLLFAVKKEHLPKLSAIYVLAAFSAAVIGIAEVTSARAAGETISRANAFMNSLRYSEVLVLALSLVLSRLALPAEETFRRERLFYKLAAAPIFCAIILTQTRSSYLALSACVAAMLYFAAAARKRIAVYAVLMLVLAAAGVAAIPKMTGRLAAMVNIRQGDFSPASPSAAINIRLELWKLGLAMVKAHPVLGVGPDNVKKVFKKFHPEPIGYLETWGSLHNLYIHQAAERGLPGLGALLLLFGAMFRFALRRFRAAPGPYTLWALCALPAYFAMNLTEISFQHVHTAFAILLALAFSAAAAPEEKL